MRLGPGKYDAECTELRQRIGADGIILIVLGRDWRAGFSAQLTAEMALAMPKILRDLAKEIERESTRQALDS